jgi:hydrogenase/urease accessory protein HupE
MKRIKKLRRWRVPLLLTSLILLVQPHAASAHLVSTGLGPVYDGIGHFCLSPDDVLPVIGVALLAGLRGTRAGRWALFLLPLAWFVGGLMGSRAAQEPQFPMQWISLLLVGILIASDISLPWIAVATISVGVGLAHGYYDGAAFAAAGANSAVITLQFIGIAVALFVLIALFAALVVSLRRDWMRIVIRVAGSWIAASGLLLLGWAIHKAGA